MISGDSESQEVPNKYEGSYSEEYGLALPSAEYGPALPDISYLQAQAQELDSDSEMLGKDKSTPPRASHPPPPTLILY